MLPMLTFNTSLFFRIRLRNGGCNILLGRKSKWVTMLGLSYLLQHPSFWEQKGSRKNDSTEYLTKYHVLPI